ncbi:MAG: hypothetical protein NT117_02065 [Gammaproteobacteria bacterium]|nr:hypothetical protein [Gammaproteobacteria bacterium]
MKRNIEFAALVTSVVLSLALAGCSKPTAAPSDDSGAAATLPTAAADALVAEAPKPLACDMVTASEMSAIVGGEVAAQPNEGSSGKTECIYTAVKGISPYVELSVEWGEGELAMKSAGAMSQVEPGITSPYDGIGDQAISVGTSLMIRTGPDLMTITFSGVDNAPAAAKKIFDTAKARM